jgi:hypothetical protein
MMGGMWRPHFQVVDMLSMCCQVPQQPINLLLLRDRVHSTDMLLSATAAAWCSLGCARAALNRLRRSLVQHCSTASRQGSGSCSRKDDESAILWQDAAGEAVEG